METKGKDVWGRGMWMKGHRGVDLEYLVSRIQVLQRVPEPDKILKNKCDKIIQPVDISYALASATPVLAQWAHQSCSCSDRNGGSE